MKKRKTPECLRKQCEDYIKSLQDAIFEYVEIVDIDNIRVWYRNKYTNRLACQLMPWIKYGAVTLQPTSQPNQPNKEVKEEKKESITYREIG